MQFRASRIQFAAGETSKTFSIPIVDDALVEGNETFNVVLSSPGGGAIEGSPFTSTILILDDDKPLILTDELTARAAALDSVTLVHEPFSLTNIHNLSSDQRTRIMIFAPGINLLPGESITAQLEDTDHHIYPLVVEDIRPLPNLPFSQITLKLPDTITLEGDHQISLSFHGVTSNKPLITIVR